jgi:hypothetical protein
MPKKKRPQKPVPKIEFNRFTVIIFAAIALTLLVPGLVIWQRSARFERVKRAYDGIKLGDSREAVTVAMGEPYTSADCKFAPVAHQKMEEELRSKCAQQYTFIVLRSVYTISFDRNGSVIAKSDAPYR